jgi:hypothetical protein
MKEYYEKNRDIIIEYNLNYYYTHKEKVRERQNNYFEKIYYPNKIINKIKKVKPMREVIISQNVTVTF